MIKHVVFVNAIENILHTTRANRLNISFKIFTSYKNARMEIQNLSRLRRQKQPYL